MICACGREETDGKPCHLGATHTTLAMLSTPLVMEAKALLLPWEKTLPPSSGQTFDFPWSTPITTK